MVIVEILCSYGDDPYEYNIYPHESTKPLALYTKIESSDCYYYIQCLR